MDPDYDLRNNTQYYNISGNGIFYREVGVIGLFVTLRGRQPQLPLAAQLREASKLAARIKENISHTKSQPPKALAEATLSNSRAAYIKSSRLHIQPSG